MADLSILLEDGPVLAVNKPAGLSTEAADPHSDSLVSRVKDDLNSDEYRLGVAELVTIPTSAQRASET